MFCNKVVNSVFKFFLICHYLMLRAFLFCIVKKTRGFIGGALLRANWWCCRCVRVSPCRAVSLFQCFQWRALFSLQALSDYNRCICRLRGQSVWRTDRWGRQCNQPSIIWPAGAHTHACTQRNSAPCRCVHIHMCTHACTSWTHTLSSPVLCL